MNWFRRRLHCDDRALLLEILEKVNMSNAKADALRAAEALEDTELQQVHTFLTTEVEAIVVAAVTTALQANGADQADISDAVDAAIASSNARVASLTADLQTARAAASSGAQATGQPGGPVDTVPSA